MTFLIEWVCYQYTVMPSGRKNAPFIFSRIAISSFKYFIHKFLEVYFDDWIVFALVRDHIESLCMMLGRCLQYQIAFNSKKCIFAHHLVYYWVTSCFAMVFWLTQQNFLLSSTYHHLHQSYNLDQCQDTQATIVSLSKDMQR